MRIPAALVVLLALPAYASFRCPARGGAQWREYRSAHFLVDTDITPEQGPPLVQRLERMRALVLQALIGEQVDIPGHLRVLVFSDESDFREMVGNNHTSGYFIHGLFGEPTVVVPMRYLSREPEVGAHEVAHYLSRYVFPIQPSWFSEGLAEWVQTVATPREPTSSPTGSHIRRGPAVSGSLAGSMPPGLGQYLQTGVPPMAAKDLLAWTGAEREIDAGRGHAWSWLLYHWLWNERGKAFSDYQKRLADSGDPGGSWRAAFQEFDPDKPEAMAALDKELDRYRFGGRFIAYPVEAESDGRLSEGTVTSGDLHLLILGARGRWPSEKAERETLRRSILDEAFAEDPGSAAAFWMRSEKKEDVVPLREAVRARPADYRGWLILGQIAPAGEREAALRKAVEINPESAMSLNELAWLLATSGRAKEALPLANRALDLAPWNASFVDTLAEVASRMGKCAEALQLERRAVLSGASESLRKRQAEIEQRCQTAAK